MLHAYIVPDEGGETEFANMAAAYDALDEGTKARCDGLIAIHDFYWSRRDINEQAFTQEERDAIPPVRHLDPDTSGNWPQSDLRRISHARNRRLEF